MAVAGLHNVSAFGPSLFGESPARVSRQWDDDHGRRIARASTVLQMWRELESEHALSQSYRSRHQSNDSYSDCRSINGDDFSQVSNEFENRGSCGSEMEHEDNNSIISEQLDLGEIERERVRAIFRAWNNSGSKGHSSYGFHLNNHSGQWLGENECQRVRVIREWTHTRNNRGLPGDGVTDVGSQIEQVRDGLTFTHPVIGARRPIRRLCGRQTLVDLLVRAQYERKRELLILSEQRPVSEFAHRNRIQALLRGRFLRNQGLVLDKRPSSLAATELGLLRQKHTVSDLREGFLSKLDNSSSHSLNSPRSGSTLTDQSNGQSMPTCTGGEVTRIHTESDLESGTDGSRKSHEHNVQISETEDTVLVNEGSEQVVSRGAETACSREAPVLDSEARQNEILTDVVYHGGEQINVNISNESLLRSMDRNVSGSFETYDENFESRRCVSYVHEVDGHTIDLEGNMNEEFDSNDSSSAQVEEFQESATETLDSSWQQQNTVAFSESAHGSRQDMVRRSWQERASSRLFPGPSDNSVEEQDQMQESHDWPSHDLQEAIDSWLDMPSGEVGTSVGRLDTYYFPDDDSVQSMEIRELFSRRHVSSLLRSSFRESLDRVLQSQVERLVHDSDDWELENTSFPSLVEQDQEQLDGDQALALSDSGARNPFAPSSALSDASHPLWHEDMQGAHWPENNSNQQLETEWEVINELRFDMAMFQQRMDSMQSMLEACMDMQLELQRLVRQEVSAALNHSIFSGDAFKDNLLHDESQWDCVRKGICCLCRDSKIDSLLYRCGHMCACTKCAENLVQSKGMCPMCRAPAVEAVRAYFTQQ